MLGKFEIDLDSKAEASEECLESVDSEVELASVVPTMSELYNGHLGELLLSCALLGADKRRHGLVLVINNSRTALLAYQMTCGYRLNELPQAIRQNTHEFRRNITPAANVKDPEALEVAKKLVVLPPDELERWLIEERTIYEENQLTLKLIEMISSTQDEIRSMSPNSRAKSEAIEQGLSQMRDAWRELYPDTKLPFGFELALKRMVKIRAVDLSSEGEALESRCIGLARQTGVDFARSAFPNLKSIHSRDADTLSHDDWWQFLWQHWEELQEMILTIPQLSRIKEPEVIESSIRQSVGSVMIDQILYLFDSRLEKYLDMSTTRLGGSQLMVPSSLFDRLAYPESDVNEDFAFAARVFKHFQHSESLQPAIWPQLMLLLYNRSRPTSWDGKNYLSQNWFTGNKDSGTVLMKQQHIFEQWQEMFLEKYSKLKALEASGVSLPILDGKSLDDWYHETALVAIDQLRKEQVRIKKTVLSIVKAIAASRAEHERVDKKLIIDSLRPRYRSIVEANPKIFNYFVEMIESLDLTTENEMMALLYHLFGDLLEPVPADFEPPDPMALEKLTVDRSEFLLNNYSFLTVVTALMAGIERRVNISAKYGRS